MGKGKDSIETFKANDGFLVAEIVRSKSGEYEVWKRHRNDFVTGNTHTIVCVREELEHAQAEAKMVVERYNQDHAE